jgi:predicted dehydrogenase
MGVVGLGRMGGYHLQKFLQLPEVDVVGVFDTDRARANELAARHGVRAYPSFAELLVDVDGLTVATPTATHYALARAALDSQVHVLVEKPITSSVEEGETLVRLARERGLVLQVGMVERFRVAALTRGVRLAPIRYIESDRLNPTPGREAAIDVVADLMIHDLDLALSLIGEDPRWFSAVGIPVLNTHHDIANVRMEFPNGAVANLNASRISLTPLRKFRIYADDAYVSIDLSANTVQICRRGASNRLESETRSAEGLDALLEQAREFAGCIAQGKEPTVSGEAGLRALRFAQLATRRIEERLAERGALPGRSVSAPSLFS